MKNKISFKNARSRHRTTTVTLLAIALVMSLGLSSVKVFNPPSPAPLSDSVKVRAILEDIVQGIRTCQPGRFLKHAVVSQQGSMVSLEQALTRLLFSRETRAFQVGSISIRFERERSSLSFRSNEGANAVLQLTMDDKTMQWQVSDFSPIEQLIKRIPESESVSSPLNSDGIESASTPVTLNYSTHTVVPVTFIDFPEDWLITKADAQAHADGKSLLSLPVEGEVVAIGSLNTQVAFILDRAWKRIFFLGIDGNWYKSYGDHAGQYQFVDPQGIRVKKKRPNGPWYIFVADAGRHEVAKFQYDHPSRTITLLQTYQSNLATPVDVDYDQNDESIWVADIGLGALVNLWSNGSLKSRIEGYYWYDGYTRIEYPTKVLIGSWGIGFIDQARNSFTTIWWYQYPVPPNVNCDGIAYRTIFPNTCFPNSIGYLWGRNFVVGDRRLGKIHLFSNEGDYLGTTGQFTNDWAQQPSKFTPILGIELFQDLISFGGSNHADETLTQQVSYSVSDWTLTSGFRRFLPGSDAILSATADQTNYYFTWRLTNLCNAYVEVLNKSNQVLQQLESGGYFYAGKYTCTVAKSSVPGAFWLRVRTLPYQNAVYNPEYRQNWGERKLNIAYMAEDGTDKPTSVNTSDGLPEQFQLHANFPNPFNPSTTIKFDLPETAEVSLVVYDMLGKEIAVLVNGPLEAGYHTVLWNAPSAGLSTGVYFTQLVVTDGSSTRLLYSKVNKMLLLK